MKLLRCDLVSLVLASLGAAAFATGPVDEVLTVPLPGGAPKIDRSFGAQPLAFEPNLGQTDAQVKFLARGKGYQLFLTGQEAVMVLHTPAADEGGKSRRDGGAWQDAAASWGGFGWFADREFPGLPNTFKSGAGTPHSTTLRRGSDAVVPVVSSADSRSLRVLRMRLVAANPSPPIQGDGGLTGKVNYFIGNDPARWRTNVPTFAKVRYRDVYPGTELVYYGNQEGRLEYDFVLAPGADPNQIALEFDGADRIELDTNGDMVAWVGGLPVRWQKPVVYQEFNGQRIKVACDYRLDGGSLTYEVKRSHRIGFELAAYDSSRPLVIDPVLVYSTYLGGSENDRPGYGAGRAIAADFQGNACVVGYTKSLNFPVTNALQPQRAGGDDAFVTKLSRSGELLFSTYLGGVGNDYAHAVALDLQGNIYVAGGTISTNFPVVKPLQAALAGSGDGYVATLTSDGATISFSTYWGGTVGDSFNGVAVDPAGNIHLAGGTGDSYGSMMNDFPVQNALQAQFGGGQDAVVVKLKVGGTGVIYSTYFGGSGGFRDGGEYASAIAADAEGYTYIVGRTTSYDLPFVNAYQAAITGDITVAGYPASDFFYARITPDGSGLVYSSYFGSYRSEEYPSLALGPRGELWLVGSVGANSEGLATPGSFQPSIPRDSWAGVVARFNATNGVLEAATYLQNGLCSSVAVDAAGDAWVGGWGYGTWGGQGLALVDPLQSSQGNSDAFVVKFSSDCSRLLFSTYFGGADADASYGLSLCLDPDGNALLFGDTESKTNFPLVNAFQTNLNGTADTFVAKISLSEVLKISRSGQTVNLSWPASATNYILEATTVLPTVSWTTVTNTPTVTTNERIVQMPLSGNARFFRLREQ